MEITNGNWVAEVGEQRFAPMQATYMTYLADGLTQKEIAKALGRSPKAVRSGLEAAYYRLGVNRGSAAVAKAVSLGWIRRAGKLIACIALSSLLTLGADDKMRRGGRAHRLSRREAEVQIYA